MIVLHDRWVISITYSATGLVPSTDDCREMGAGESRAMSSSSSGLGVGLGECTSTCAT